MVQEHRLIGAILIQAVKDWQQPTRKEEISEFLHTPWFAELTEALEMDQTILREKLITGEVKVTTMRAAYRKRYAA